MEQSYLNPISAKLRSAHTLFFVIEKPGARKAFTSSPVTSSIIRFAF